MRFEQCIAVVAAALVAVAAAGAYDDQCNIMINAAKMAATKHNAGDTAGAEAQIARVRAAFQKAKSIDPSHPQAYLNFAVFLSNTHKYNESLAAFDEALARIGDNKQARQQIEMTVRKTKYEMYSMHRDAAYQKGNGDLFEAHRWAQLQLLVTREPHRIKHDIATIEMMLCENNRTYCNHARDNFQGASMASFQRYILANTPENKKLRMKCLHSHFHVGRWGDGQGDITSNEVAPGLFVNVVFAQASVIGPDGMLKVHIEGDCSLYSSAADLYPNLADATEPRRPPAGGFIEKRVLSLVKFSSSTFYHWLCESLPALAVAKRHLADFDTYHLLVPSTNFVLPPFVNATLTTLFAGWGNLEERIVPYVPDVKLIAGTASVTWQEQPCPSEGPAAEGEEEGSPQFGCAALPHPEALKIAREEIHAALGPLVVPAPENAKAAVRGDSSDPYILVAMRGNNVTMRNFDELTLYRQIANLASSVSHLPVSFSVRAFDSSDYNFTQALQLFRGATIIVGAHGGALANIIACREGAHLVEIGFSSQAAQHYHHIARALGLAYHRVPIAPDAKGRGLGAATIDVDIDKALRAVLVAMKSVSDRVTAAGAEKSEEL